MRSFTQCSIIARRRAAIAAALLLTLMLPALASAHPLGNFTINHYSRIEVSPSQVRTFYVLDMAEIPTFQTIRKLIDTDGDGQVNPDEQAKYAPQQVEALASNLELKVNGKPLTLIASSPQLTFLPGQGNLKTMRLTFWLDATVPPDLQGEISVEFTDNNEPDRVGWREIVVRSVDGMKVANSTVSEQDVSDELRTYPQDLLSSPLRQTSASFSFNSQGSGPKQKGTMPGDVSAQSFGSAQQDGEFAELINIPDLSPNVAAAALLTAVGLGALHALEPGHGKTAAAAYLVGSRATVGHALLLGTTITIMHTSSVFLLGFVTLFLAQVIAPERLLPWLGLASGLIVILMGIRMFVSRIHGGDNHGHSHVGLSMHDHSASGSHTHDHKPMFSKGAKMGWRGALAVGISGGLVPCPAAIIVLLSAIGLGRMGFGILLIVAFSVGLALVLGLIGVSVLYGQRWLSRRGADSRIAQLGPRSALVVEKLPAFSGLLVIGAGLLLLYHALPFLRILQ